MLKKEYEVMFNMEDEYWWYIGLRELIMSFIERINKKGEKLKILDAGCGTGMMLESCKYHEVYGLDFSKEALKYCKLRNLTDLMQGSINDLPFKNNYFDIVFSFDVIGQELDFPRSSSNIIKDNIRTLKEIGRVMNKNGILILNLPAYNFIRSNHDKAVGINRRYTIKELKDSVQKAGFEIENITYRNTILFPISVVKRIIDRKLCVEKEEPESDLKPLPCWINRLFIHILFFENKLIRSGVRLPFGMSIYCVSRKKK